MRVNRVVETFLDTKKHRGVIITWHAKGVLIESNEAKMVVPQGNIAWVEIR